MVCKDNECHLVGTEDREEAKRLRDACSAKFPKLIFSVGEVEDRHRLTFTVRIINYHHLNYRHTDAVMAFLDTI